MTEADKKKEKQVTIINKLNIFQKGLFLLVILSLITMVLNSSGVVVNSGSCEQEKQLSGAWEGSFKTQEFPGKLKLVLKNEAGDWSGTLEIFVGTDTALGPLLDMKVEGNKFSCRFTATGSEVKLKGEANGDKMTGSLSVYSEGNLIDEGTFECTREKI